MKNYYEELGVAPSADLDEIRQAYEQKIELVGGGYQRNELEKIFSTLNDPGLRTQYDAELEEEKRSTSLVVGDQAAIQVLGTNTPVIYCPHCQSKNPQQASICTNCSNQISRACPQCGYKVSLNEQICPRCDTYFPEYDQQRFAQAKMVENRVKTERTTSKVRLNILEAGHTRGRVFGIVFWAIVFVSLTMICIGSNYLFTVMG